MKSISITLATTALFISASNLDAEAQILSPLTDGETALYLNYTPDPDLYYAVGFATGDGEVMHVTDLEVPTDPETTDWRLKLGGQASIFEGIPHGWDISPAVSVIIRHRVGGAYKLSHIGLDFTGLFGYYGGGWFAIGEYGYDRYLAEHAGLRLGASIRPVELVLRIGEPRTEKSGDQYQITIGANYRY